MPLQMFVFAMLTLVVGMGFGWAWGAAAMKAALTARSQTFLASQIQRAQQGYVVEPPSPLVFLSLTTEVFFWIDMILID